MTLVWLTASSMKVFSVTSRSYAKLDLKGVRNLESGLNRMKKQTVDFGFPEPTIHSPSGMTHGHLAKILEYGIRGKIPARPAMRQTVEGLLVDRKGFEEVIKAPMANFLTSKNHIVDAVSRASGHYLSEAYADTMDYWSSVGSSARNNAPLTIDLKGFNKPFEQTGELISSTDYRING